MKIAIGADHRGQDTLNRVVDILNKAEHEVITFIPDGQNSADYPDFAWKVGRAVADGDAELGILIDGSGVGMCIAANKIRGVRAAPVHDEITAEISRAHVNANVLCLSADLLGMRLIEKIVHLWLNTTFSGGRHDRRVRKIDAIHDDRDPTQID